MKMKKLVKKKVKNNEKNNLDNKKIEENSEKNDIKKVDEESSISYIKLEEFQKIEKSKSNKSPQGKKQS